MDNNQAFNPSEPDMPPSQPAVPPDATPPPAYASMPPPVADRPGPAQRPHGCITAVLVFLAFGLAGAAGGIWLLTLLPDFGIEGLAPDLIRSVGYSLLLIVPFGTAALLMRKSETALWRGIALMLALTGFYTLPTGIVLAVDRSLDYPGLPAVLPAIVSLIIAIVLTVAGRQRFLGAPVPGPLMLGAGLGLIVSAGWAIIGALGTPAQLALALLEAIGTGWICALLLATIFFYDQDMLAEHPFWSAVLVGTGLAAILSGILAVRGWFLQGNTLAYTMTFYGAVAGVLLTMSGERGLRRNWWSMAAFFIMAYFLPFAFTEGLEGDYMYDEFGPAWGPALLSGQAAGFLVALLMLVLLNVRQVFLRLLENTAIPAGFSTIVGLAILITYVVFGQPGVQPNTFFVVMADQADTAFAREIADRDERVQAVYDTLTAFAEEDQAGLRALLDGRRVQYRPFYLINAIEVEGTVWLRLRIAARDDVAYILNTPLNRPIPEFAPEADLLGTLAVSEPVPGALAWGVDQIDAEQVWERYGVTGQGIIVGGADSGVDWQHPRLIDRYVGSEDSHDYTWFDPRFGATEPLDMNGHGTHTMGTIVGQDGIGVAPGARYIACRNLARNLGNPPDYVACMQFLFAPFPPDGDPLTDGEPARGAHLTNNSWGCPFEEGCDGSTLDIAVEHLRNAGQMFVVSAGNEGPECGTVWMPASADAAFSVGAIQGFASGGEEAVTSFSSRGPVDVDGSGRPKPDVVAPGYQIISAIPNNRYAPLFGTSMAGPHVAGLVALMWSANPDLIGDIDRTEEIIIETATYLPVDDPCGTVGGEAYNNTSGYGFVNALAAVELALADAE